MPKSRGRRRVVSAKARETQAAQQQAAHRKQLTLAQYHLRRFFGWSLVTLGVGVGVSHWLAHIQLWRFASSGVMDLVAGYPMAVILVISGSIVLTKA